MPCTEAVRVKTPAGQEAELVPKKVWTLKAPKGKPLKIGLFQDPSTNKFFRAKLAEAYPDC